MEQRIYHLGGTTLQCIKTDKFKTFSIALRFAGAFLPSTINARALLPDVLLGGTKKNPSKEALQTRMDELYGLSISSGTEKVGRQSVIFFEMKFVNGIYLPGDGTTVEDALNLLAEIIFQPKLFKNGFRKKTVQEEVRLLKEDFEAEYADKTEFAYGKFMNAMFDQELHKYRAKGIYETLDEMTPELLFSAYQDLLKNDEVTILAVGNFEFEPLRDLIARKFSFSSPDQKEVWLDLETKVVSTPQVLWEETDINQARINIGYRLNMRFGDDLFYEASIMNAILGEFEHSKLFQVVREKHTLCYYINSSYDSNKGVISILAGVDPEKVEKALSVIQKVVKSIQDGEISEEEISLAKLSLSKRIRQNVDSPERISNLAFIYRKIQGNEFDVERSLSTIENVQKSDIIALSQKMILDTTYILTKKEN